MNTNICPFMNDLGNTTVVKCELTVGQLKLLADALRETDISSFTTAEHEELSSMIGMFSATVEESEQGTLDLEIIQGYCL